MRIWEVWVCVMTAAVLGVTGGSGGGSLESADLAWLLVQESPSSQPQTGAQVSVRRITPKSVFLAPTFTSCSEGYRQDSLGRCVKVVKVNPSAQWDFFLHKLNSMYGPPEPNNKPNTGPFRLPIPLATEPPTTTTTTTTAVTSTTEQPMSSTVTEQTTILPFTTTTEEPTTEVPFVIIVANTTELPTTTSAATEPTSTTIVNTPPTSTTSEPISESTTLCDNCEQEETTTFTITTPATIMMPLKTTIIFPDSNRNRRPSSPLVRFPESQQQSPYWWPHSWEHRLWQPPPAYYPPRQSAYRGHREARPAWQN